MSATLEPKSTTSPASIPVWDLPVRLFHWTLVALVAFSWTTVQIGGNAMLYHAWSGYTVLTLVLFRILWGFWGGTHARFRDFVAGPRAAFGYAQALLQGRPPHYVGHNPLGGSMVIALLVVVLLQAATGLFANDDIFFNGPLYRLVDKDTSDALTRFHDFNSTLLMILIGLHVAAAVGYLLILKENLIVPMLSGRKPRPESPVGDATANAGPARALLLLGVAACSVYLLVR